MAAHPTQRPIPRQEYSIIKYTAIFGTIVVGAYMLRSLITYATNFSTPHVYTPNLPGTNTLLLMMLTAILPIVFAYGIGMFVARGHKKHHVAPFNGFVAAAAYIWVYTALNPLSFTHTMGTTTLPLLPDHLLRTAISFTLVLVSAIWYVRISRARTLAHFPLFSLLLVAPTVVLTFVNFVAGIAALSVPSPSIQSVTMGVMLLTPVIAGFGVLGMSYEHFKNHLKYNYDRVVYAILSVLLYALTTTVISMLVETFIPKYFFHIQTAIMLVGAILYWGVYFICVRRHQESGATT